MQQITNLSTSVLKVHLQNQEFFDDIEGEQYEKFKKSIQEDGIITPLIVSPDMTIISGHQRYKACKDLGIELIPVIINESLINEDDKLKKLLAANFGRLKNNPVKQGKVFAEYEKLSGIYHGNHQTRQNVVSQEDIAKELGVDVRTIQRLKKLQTLSPELQQLIEDGSVKYTTALNVYAKLTPTEQSQLIEELGKDKIAEMTQKQTEQYLLEKKSFEDAKKLSDSSIEEIRVEKRGIETKLLLLQETLKTKTIEYVDNPDNLTEIETLKKQIKEKEEYVQKYKDTLKELNEKNQLVSKFMGESTNFEIISTTSEITLKIMNFVKEMAKYDYISEVFNDIPDATRKEWVRSIFGVYKWSKSILNTVKHDDVLGVNTNIIDVKIEGEY